jgi:hypothetical protein
LDLLRWWRDPFGGDHERQRIHFGHGLLARVHQDDVMRFTRVIHSGPDRVLLSVRNGNDTPLLVGAAVLWAFGYDSGLDLGHAVIAANLTGVTVNGQYWRLAGVVVDRNISSNSWGIVQAYGVVDSVLVSNWTNWTRFPHMVLRPHADPSATQGICSGYSVASTYGVTGGVDEWKPYHACALFPAARGLNTQGTETTVTGTGYIRGFIRAL